MKAKKNLFTKGMVHRWWYHPKQNQDAQRSTCFAHFSEADASKASKVVKVGNKRHYHLCPFKAMKFTAVYLFQAGNEIAANKRYHIDSVPKGGTSQVKLGVSVAKHAYVLHEFPAAGMK